MTDTGQFAKHIPFPVGLTIAGSDSGGGAGIQADLKTFHQFSVVGTSVITAVTAQNTLGITDIHLVPVATIHQQLQAVLSDLAPAAIKTGMLANAETIDVVVEILEKQDTLDLVVDPVMVATSGDRLLDPDAIESVRNKLCPIASLLTPNLHETALLVQHDVESPGAMEHAGRELLEMGAHNALVKGGHLAGDMLVDVLVTREGVETFRHKRINSTSTHGTGCTLSAAIAAMLAHGMPLIAAVGRALDFVHTAIRTAPPLGQGHGPLNHFAAVEAS